VLVCSSDVPCPLKVFVVAEKNTASELARLRKKQQQAQQEEVYGGFSKSERAEYDSRAERINELETQLQTVTSDEAAAEQRHEWNKKSETDTPPTEGRQPNRTREQNSTNASTDSLKTVQTKKKPNPEGNRE
jgi:hypothetical protein